MGFGSVILSDHVLGGWRCSLNLSIFLLTISVGRFWSVQSVHFVGEARGAGMVVNWDVCVVIDKVKVGWNVTCALGSESTEEE